MAEIVLCQFTNKPATHSFTWEWGDSGYCCAEQVPLLQQQAANLGRSITFALISDAGTQPLQREERVRLRAEALVLSEELEEAKQRGLELYRQNVLLTQQVQSLTVSERESQAQRKDAVVARDEMDGRLQALEAENAQLSDELSRLRVLVDIAPPQEDTRPGVGAPIPATIG